MRRSAAGGEPAPGSMVGRFILVERLGEGGMGVVYAAFDPELDRKVALKLVRPARYASEGSDSDDVRLLREAQAIARLSHPNVVAVYDVGTFQDQVFLALEYIEGMNLEDWIEKEEPSLRQILGVFAAAGRGLVAAHEAGILHRDIKPENIMVGPGARVRLVDFGLARALDVTEKVVAEDAARYASRVESPPGSSPPFTTSVTQAGALLGTPSYMAPELFADEKADERSDQYSFCVALYRTLYDRLPHNFRTLYDYVREAGKQRKVEFPPRGQNFPVPPWIREILDRGLNSDPAQRFASMKELLHALERDPVAIRRRWLAVAATLLVVIVSTASLANWWQARSLRCDASRTRMMKVWNPQQRMALGRAFEALRTPFAAATWPIVAKGLDEYSKIWKAAFVEACEDTYTRGTQSEELFDLRSECLGNRLRDFEALIGVLEQVDGDMLERTPQAVTELPGFASWFQSRLLRTLKARDISSEAAVRIEQARETLSEAQARFLAGQFLAARKIIEPLLNDLERGALPGLEAAVLQQLGKAESALGDYDLARRHHIEAMTAALSALQDDLAVEALRELAWVEGNYQRRFEIGFEWLGMAQSMAGRLDAQPFRDANLMRLEASLKFHAGDYTEAERSFRGALLRFEGLDSRVDLGEMPIAHMRGVIAMNLAVVLQVVGKAEEALEAYDTAVELLSATQGGSHPKVAEAKFNRATALAHLGRKEEAIAELQGSLEKLSMSLGERHPRVGIPLNNLGVLMEEEGRIDEALGLYNEALEIYKAAYPNGHAETARTLNNLAHAYILLEDRNQARQLATESLTMLEHVSGPDHPEIVAPLQLLAQLEIQEGFPERAIAPLERALQITRQESNFRNRAEVLFNLAKALWNAQRNRPRALELALEARSLFEGEGELFGEKVKEVGGWLEERGGDESAQQSRTQY